MDSPAISPTEVTFAFEGLAKPDRVWLRRTAAEIRVRLRRTSADLLVIGRLLVNARRRLGSRGRFGEWVEKEIHLPRRTITRLMQVARAFSSLTYEAAKRIAPTALYAMSEPAVPQSFREYIAEEALGGREITGAEAAALLADHQDRGKAPLSLARVADPPRSVDADEVHARENWSLLRRLLEEGNTIHLDTWGGEDDKLVTVVRIAEGQRPQQVVAKSLEECLLEIAGESRTKVCGACATTKRLTEFSKAKDSADGRNRRCLECERQRVKMANAKKRLHAGQSGQAEATPGLGQSPQE